MNGLLGQTVLFWFSLVQAWRSGEDDSGPQLKDARNSKTHATQRRAANKWDHD